MPGPIGPISLRCRTPNRVGEWSNCCTRWRSTVSTKPSLSAAQIDHNPQNNEYIAEVAAPHAGKLFQFPDVDCSWSTTYHTPGAADRLRAIAERWPIKGFTHYLRQEDDGWLVSDEGTAFFQVAADHKLIASIAGSPRHEPVLRQVAERFPSVPILRHHLAGVKASEPPPHEMLKQVLASAKLPNIYIKFSGFHYCSSVRWGFPLPGYTLDYPGAL